MKKGTPGERLRALRGSRSQEEVAKAVGISQSALSFYEQDLRTPRDRIKVKLCAYYKRPIQTIFF